MTAAAAGGRAPRQCCYGSCRLICYPGCCPQCRSPADERGTPPKDGGRGPHRRQGHRSAVRPDCLPHGRWQARCAASVQALQAHEPRLLPRSWCRHLGAPGCDGTLVPQRRELDLAAASVLCSSRAAHQFVASALLSAGRRRLCTRPPPLMTSGCRCGHIPALHPACSPAAATVQCNQPATLLPAHPAASSRSSRNLVAQPCHGVQPSGQAPAAGATGRGGP